MWQRLNGDGAMGPWQRPYPPPHSPALDESTEAGPYCLLHARRHSRACVVRLAAELRGGGGAGGQGGRWRTGGARD